MEDSDDEILLCGVTEPSKTKKEKTKPVLKSSKSASAWVSSAFDDFDGFGRDLSSSQSTTATRKRPRDAEKTVVETHGRKTAARDTEFDAELWAEKHAPKTVTELAVHKKKIQEVQTWLEHAFKSKHKEAPMLLLTGPSGVGKTATVRCVAAEKKCEVQEWINPVADTFDKSLAAWRDKQDFVAVGMSTYESQSSQFQDFLLRANRYPTLQIFQQDQLHRKLILVEDLPNVFFRDPAQFHGILRDYHGRGQCPIVFITSDSAGGESNERLLFPKDIQSYLNIANISFNPIAQTSLVKVLTRIASLETSRSKKCGKFEVPDKLEIERLATNSAGDIRGALNALQFTCLRGTQPQTVFEKAKSSKSKIGSVKVKAKGKRSDSKKKTAKAKESDKQEELASIGGRDTSLFLFRALGKILYCKRGDPSDYTDLPELPSHLRQYYRDPLLLQPEEVVEKSHLSGDFFTAYLHENYVEFYHSIEDLVNASQYLSDADYLTIDWASRSTLKDYASSVAARGLMFCNTARASSSGGGSSGLGFKPLHKPQWYTICKQARDNVTAAKQLFKGYCPPVELQTQVIPYIASIGAHTTPGQRMFVSEVGRIQKYTRRRNYERLDEKDVSDLPDDSESQASAQTINTPSTGVTDSAQTISAPFIEVKDSSHDELEQNEADDDFVIEEFDD